MGSQEKSGFNIHFVTIYDEDEDTTTSYYELLEKPETSHGLFNSFADAEAALRSLRPDPAGVNVTFSAEITIAGNNMHEQRANF